VSTYAHLLIFAEALDDIERLRIATDNRIRAMVDVHGLEGTPEHKQLVALSEVLHAQEHGIILTLRRAMRAHPLGLWVRETVGVGEKQAARLLAAIGDPAERPNVAKLWQYCGHGDPARSHCRRGQPVEHSPTAKMRTRTAPSTTRRAPRGLPAKRRTCTSTTMRCVSSAKPSCATCGSGRAGLGSMSDTRTPHDRPDPRSRRVGRPSGR
jgi:transposase